MPAAATPTRLSKWDRYESALNRVLRARSAQARELAIVLYADSLGIVFTDGDRGEVA